MQGKSTTASMLAYVLKAMDDDLTAVVGAYVPQVSLYVL
jgi:UDP-N-acetylmuramate-alanine ligase